MDCSQCDIEMLKRSMYAVFDMVPVAIWVTDDAQIMYANPACVSLFGAASREDLVGRSVYAFLKPPSHEVVRRQLGRVLREPETRSVFTEQIARLDGSARDVVIAAASLPDHGRTAAQMAIVDMTAQVQVQFELERSRRQLQALSADLVNAREQERRNVARELHDELGQRLAAIKMELARLSPLLEEPEHGGRLRGLFDLVDDTVASVRRMATELRPLILDDLGLLAAIESLVKDSERRMCIQINCLTDGHIEDFIDDLEEASAIALYRIVQEALTNIARHAQATRVLIELAVEADMLRLTVQDNGVGMSEQAMFKDGSHGLMGIRERAHMLGGRMEVSRSRLLSGAQLSVWVPLHPPPAEPQQAPSPPPVPSTSFPEDPDDPQAP